MTDTLTNTSLDFADVPVALGEQPSTATYAPGADPATLERVDSVLADVQRLSSLLLEEDTPPQVEYDPSYRVPPLDYELPTGFRLSVIIPVFNEEPTLRELVQRVRALPLPLDIVIVDDCSTDGTRAILYELETYADVKIVYKRHNEGKGAALRTGMEHATGNAVIVQDADLEYDPRDIPALLRPIVEDTADVVYGSRFSRGANANSSPVHRFGNWALTAASNLTTGLKLTDMETCYKAFRRDAMQGLDLKQNRFGFEPEITAKIARRGYRVQELPIGYEGRDWDAGKKIGIRDALNALWCIVRYARLD